MSQNGTMSKEKTHSTEEKALLAEQVQVQEELSNLRGFMRSEVDTDPEEGDTEISEREKNAVLIGVLERKLKDITTALQSMEKGKYGICERCDNSIEPERLEFKPDSILCVGCQREVERLSRRGRM